jgi:GMP synthase-like glutamine amidotransferase
MLPWSVIPTAGIPNLAASSKSGPIFAARGATITYTRFFAGELPPDPDAYDLLVVLGGPMGVHDDAEIPWLAAEKAALKTALDAGKPVLGLCLGAQLIAAVLGARVFANTHREIGWWPVERLPEAAEHPFAACFPERLVTFHWHGDTFDIPEGATPLFRSEACANQGFAVGDRVLALQFHPEITPEAVQAWIAASDGYHRAPGAWIQDEAAMRGIPALYAENRRCMEAACDALLRSAVQPSAQPCRS